MLADYYVTGRMKTTLHAVNSKQPKSKKSKKSKITGGERISIVLYHSVRSMNIYVFSITYAFCCTCICKALYCQARFFVQGSQLVYTKCSPAWSSHTNLNQNCTQLPTQAFRWLHIGYDSNPNLLVVASVTRYRIEAIEQSIGSVAIYQETHCESSNETEEDEAGLGQ